MGQFLIAVLILLSMVLTLAVPFPTVSEEVIATILIGGSVVAIAAILSIEFPAPAEPSDPNDVTSPADLEHMRLARRMPPLGQLPPARLTLLERVWLLVLRAYLVLAAGLVLIRITMLATVGA